VLRFGVLPDAAVARRPVASGARVVAIIPARYASSRLPGKPLADLGGRPMVEHVYRRVARAALVDQVVVATDDARVADAVAAFGGIVAMTSPAHRSGTDRVAEAAARFEATIVVNVQGDEPLIAPGAVDQAVSPLLADPTVTIATLASRITAESDYRDPSVVKVVVDRAGRALFFSRAPIPHVGGSSRATAEAVVRRHLGLYAFRREALDLFARLPPTPLEQAESLEQLRALEHGLAIAVVDTTCESIGVDTPDDLERVRRLLATRPEKD
jgi:3-deoxy-manno-octulosonate cytidylyltransferase (CMP-KDO synthetase)